ncbi:glutathione S-transferase family protein [Luteimonas kalidii]|uniref:Glutathione S-transferase family protein n=1 Tax=Luteimonas kalidii TaxID=3042025 RepID=A0ABT6JS39_9GAMM|nr:glutathione S-transferase family protein [Luteimonas kalidii]MDH5833500.1 glutathione S-transferase family protein [Luteimonas kalidii]
MTPLLYAHPFSSYCQKVLVALYETGTPFELRRIDDEAHMEALASRWPLRRFPILVDGGRTVLEASTIIEYLQLHHPAAVRMIPEDADLALEVRMMDRVFDNYVSTPQQKCTFDAIRPAEARDAHGVAEARTMLDTIYAWLDARLADRTWAAGETFSLADCGAAPFLFYAQWTHAIPERHAHLHAYRRRLMDRPSFARVLEEARPFRGLFPLGKIEDE